MAIGNGNDTDIIMEDVDVADYISDDSSFYGTPSHRASLEATTTIPEPSQWWKTHETSIPRLAALARTAEPPNPTPSTPLYNPYESDRSARQTSETVDEFLGRLPPATTQLADVGPWLWIANLHEPRRPLEDDVAGFKEAGGAVLESWKERRAEIEKTMRGKSQAAISRAITKEKKGVEEALLKLAAEKGCTTGKNLSDQWMLFPTPSLLASTWSHVAHATAASALGVSGKVATFEPGADRADDRATRLVCVYTRDFRDVDDVRRVLRKLVELEVVGTRWGVFYKTDAWTHLGITSSNEYGFKASMYSSKEILGGK
ncbi:MAG: hypothetical protein M1833_002334 [Piccolia ochrophora]|nr:MAG: hypothetical protein M1833_002334 [Piccolia ochrophora]